MTLGMATPEGLIEKAILRYLGMRGDCLFWKVKTTGTYDAKLGRYRVSSPLYRKGVADIICVYKGQPLAIEVKSEKGRLSVEQQLFLKEFVEHGGRALVARSVEHVMKFFSQLDSPPSVLR